MVLFSFMPASLTECGFLDSSTDIQFVLDPKWSRKIALGIAEGICEVYGGTVKGDANESVAVQPAKSFDENLAGTYETIVADLKLRAGANTRYAVLASMPKGAKVQCYGYYTRETDGTVWLYVVYNGQTGFVSRGFLK